MGDLGSSIENTSFLCLRVEEWVFRLLGLGCLELELDESLFCLFLLGSPMSERRFCSSVFISWDWIKSSDLPGRPRLIP